MEAGRARRNRDDSPRLPALSLGLSSVRLIVNQLENEYARVASNVLENREIVRYDPKVDGEYDDYHDSPLVYTKAEVLCRFVENLGLALSKCIPSVTFGNFAAFAITTSLLAPKMISYLVVYPFCRLVFGTLYPAYASYKAVRTKNLKEYVKWMMYWIVFALFTCTETFTDVFLSWFPFYYEVKIVLVLWLLSPATKGSSILYRKFVHPALCRREQEIDEYIAKAKDQGYHTVLNLGTKGVNYATTVIMQTAIKGGGGLVQQLRKSYSLSDLTECDPREERGSDEADDVITEPRLIRRGGKSGYSTRRSASESNSRSPMYFPEVDVDVRSPRPRTDEPDFSHIKSSEDISSGYSSADNSASLTRTASLGPGARVRARTSKTTITSIKRPQAAEESEVIIEEPQDDDNFEYANMPPLVKVQSQLYISHTDPPFLYQYVDGQVKIIQVLGNYPLQSNSNYTTDDTDIRDQKEATVKENSIAENVLSKENTNVVENVNDSIKNNNSIDIPSDDTIEDHDTPHIQDVSTSLDDKELILENIDKGVENTSISSPNENNNTIINRESLKCEIDKVYIESESNISSSMKDFDSAESDDEASFGTPENSPRNKRKSPKGKYGKGKAPLPPNVENTDIPKTDGCEVAETSSDFATSQESLADIIKNPPSLTTKEFSLNNQIINPIAENKTRHKSKSPARVQKGSVSGLGRLLQLPSKFAFWQKSDDKMKSDDVSTSSGDHSRRSSTIDEFQSCNDLNAVASEIAIATETSMGVIEVPSIEINDAKSDFKDPSESKLISQDIIDKSKALQKIIDAKLENHPEYKLIPLHEEIPTASKSTDV